MIQLHAPTDSGTGFPDISSPAPDNIYAICKPPPVGSFPARASRSYSAINSPALWNRLQPIFGARARRSRSGSRSATRASAPTGVDDSESDQLFFKGTNPRRQHRILGARRPELPAILTGTIQDSTSAKPYVDTDLRTIVFDSQTIVDADDIYLRNVSLFRRFLVRLNNGTAFDFEVGTSTFDPVSHQLALTVSASGSPLSSFSGASVEVRPRFFRVVTSNTPNFLPATSVIKVEFQATATGLPGQSEPRLRA
jgi:hypothetical protein